jgi:hypothetical protein
MPPADAPIDVIKAADMRSCSDLYGIATATASRATSLPAHVAHTAHVNDMTRVMDQTAEHVVFQTPIFAAIISAS